MKLIKARVVKAKEYAVEAYPLGGLIHMQGLTIAVENPAGSIRRWGTPPNNGETVMLYPYGYILGPKGADGDELDAYVGPNRDSSKVFIVNQKQIANTKRFDEHKVMLGFDSARAAKKAYLAHYNAVGPKIIGAVREWSMERFKKWLDNGRTQSPARKAKLYVRLEAPDE